MRSLLITPLVLGLFTQRGRFESLEECEKAYNELLGTQQVSVAPEYVEHDEATAGAGNEGKGAAPKAEEETTTTTTTGTTTKPPLKPKHIGDINQHDAKMAYYPPRTDGKMDAENGWDYADHGDDWASRSGGESCDGAGQSPIDIVRYVDIDGQTKSVLWFDYYGDQRLPEVELHMRNNGHGIHVHDPQVDLGYVKLAATEYEAYGYAFHAPSEHTIDGQVFPLEMQILHKDSAGHILAIAVFFKYGASNDYLAALKESTPEMPAWSVEHGAAQVNISGTHPAAFNLEHVLNKGSVHPGTDLTFYNYPGSLTQPPCTGGVSWWVSAEAAEATQEEVQHVRKAIFNSPSTKRGNARSVQPIGPRKVTVGHTGFQHHVKQHGHRAQNILARGYSSRDAPWESAPAGEAPEAAAESE